jgi:hypothetical protein
MTRLRPSGYAGQVRALVLLAALSGCTSMQGQAIEAAMRETGRAEAAAALDTAEWFRCRASPVGAIVDRYGANEARWSAYRQLCAGLWAGEGAVLPAGR